MLDAAAAQRTLDASPFGPWWGFEVDTVGTGRATVRLAARPELYRPGGVLQGGCAMTLADVAFWVAIMGAVEGGEDAVTLEQTSTFLGAARTDLVLRGGAAPGPAAPCSTGPPAVRDTGGALVTHHTLTYLRPPSAFRT